MRESHNFIGISTRNPTRKILGSSPLLKVRGGQCQTRRGEGTSTPEEFEASAVYSCYKLTQFNS
jgi:hypothetical protein